MATKTTTHSTPVLFKEKIRQEQADIQRMQMELKRKEAYLNDIVGAYVLGAQLPQQNLRLDENFNFVYEVEESESDNATSEGDGQSGGDFIPKPLTRHDRIERH